LLLFLGKELKKVFLKPRKKLERRGKWRKNISVFWISADILSQPKNLGLFLYPFFVNGKNTTSKTLDARNRIPAFVEEVKKIKEGRKNSFFFFYLFRFLDLG